MNRFARPKRAPGLAYVATAVGLMVLGLNSGCAVRPKEVVHAPKAALPKYVSPPAAVTHEPHELAMPQGPCDSDSFLSSDGRCVPLAWHCAPLFYAGGESDGCDCNCGAPDPDCALPHAPKWCYRLGATVSVASCQACP